MSSKEGNDDYVCTLDEKSLKKAKEELNEDPKNRLGAVETFRQWILQQPHIKCPTDTAFLLCFLRVRYFAQLEARELLERFLTKRAKFSKWFQNLDPGDPKILAAIDDGYGFPLPKRDEEGRKIFVFKPGFMDFNDKKPYSKTDGFRAMACLYDYLFLMDEVTCVNGTVTFGDVSQYSVRVHMQVSLEERRDFLQTWQGAYPVRIKEMHMYNAGAMADVAIAVMKFCLSEKIHKRFKNHGDTLESVYKDIPMHLLPAEYLPDDYKGSHAGTQRQIIDDLKKDLLKPEVRARIKYLSSDQFGIDESKRPKDEAPQASFRKLNID